MPEIHTFSYLFDLFVLIYVEDQMRGRAGSRLYERQMMKHGLALRVVDEKQIEGLCSGEDTVVEGWGFDACRR